MHVSRDIPDLEIRRPREEDFHQIVELSNLAFGEETSREDEEVLRRLFPFDRALCAYDSGRVVGCIGVYSMELTLPGRTALPAGGVTWAGTLPTHRRRGILRALLAREIEDMTRRGEAISVLLASESHIYPRFGYGPATSVSGFSIERAHAAFVDPPAGGVPRGIALVRDDDVAGRLAPIYEALRLERPGTVSRPAAWWADYLRDPIAGRQGATKMYHAIHTAPDGTADGYVTYRLKERWEGDLAVFEAQVVDLAAADRDAYKALWHYILGTDLCRTISCAHSRTDEPLRWLLADPRRLMVNALADDLYLRLLDVPRALAAREYATAGELVIEVSETFPAPKAGRYLLKAGGPAAANLCEETQRPPDLVLAGHVLAMTYLGAVSFTGLARACRVEAARPEALARADAIFSTPIAPFCSTHF